MSLQELETALRLARREVFNPDDLVAAEASARITELREQIATHPEALARSAARRCEAEERLLFRWL